MTTGQLIRAARKKTGITQTELAQKLNIPFQSVSQWERDLRNPKYETIKRIAAALNVEWTELVPEDMQGQTVIDHIKGKLEGVKFVPDDEEMLKILLPRMSELEPLTNEEAALKTLLNSMGYDIMKTRGKYFFTYKSGGSEISKDDLNELINCAQNGLKVAAKALELKLLQEAFATSQSRQQAPQPTPPTSEDNDTTPPPDAPETPPEG